MELIGAGEVGASLIVLVLGIVIAFLIDDDDLPGPKRCLAPQVVGGGR